MIFDFYEILAQGIIAARTERYKEAVKFLRIAAKLEPSNPRVWLWLATASETIALKRKYLQEALKVNPNTLAASILLDRLNKTETAFGKQASKIAIFVCPQCGGKQRFDPMFRACCVNTAIKLSFWR